MDSDSSEESTPVLKRPKKNLGGTININNNTSHPIPPSGIKLKREELKQQKKNRKLKKLMKHLDSKNDSNKTKDAEESSSTISKSKEKQNFKKAKQKQIQSSQEPINLQPDTEEIEEDFNIKVGMGRSYSVSIAVPGSIIDNAQSPPLKAYLAGQVARAAAIFNVDEIIVYDDTGGNSKPACEFMARILQFLECPQYLRKYLFPLHPDLQFSGVIAPLDIPHHLRRHEVLPYREGVVTSKPTKEGKPISYVYVGLDRDCRVEKKIPEGVRVTVKFDDPSPSYVLMPKGKLRGIAVSPNLPRTESGVYWGYTVRIAKSLNKVFTEIPYRDAKAYDVTIGTSEKGSPVQELSLKKSGTDVKHILIVFGGVEGLEYAMENDETLMEDEVSDLFNHYVNTCPTQGSRTIRSEEAILISMTALSPIIVQSTLSDLSE